MHQSSLRWQRPSHDTRTALQVDLEGKHSEALGAFFRCCQLRVCVWLAGLFLLWFEYQCELGPRCNNGHMEFLHENTRDRKETNNQKKKKDRRTHTQACEPHREALLSFKHRAGAHTSTLSHSNTPSCGRKLIPTAVLPSGLSHTLPLPPLLCCPALPVSCVQGRLREQQKGGCGQISANPAYWYTADRLKLKCLTFYLLQWRTLIAYKYPRQIPSPTHTQTHSPGIYFLPLVSWVLCIRARVRALYAFALFSWSFFLISPRAFKIWPGQMGKGVWPTLMDSTPI